MEQVETDEVYVGVDKRGAHFVVPVQAKGGTDSISVVQIEQLRCALRSSPKPFVARWQRNLWRMI